MSQAEICNCELRSRGRYTEVVRTLAVLVVWLSIAAPVHAQSDELGAIAQRSDTIVIARCVDTHSHWDDARRIIVTDVSLAVERSLKGAAATHIVVRTLGGRAGNIGMGASHATSFTPGVRVVAFTRQSRFGSYHVVTSAALGALVVRDDGAGAYVTLGTRAVDIDQLARRIGKSAE